MKKTLTITIAAFLGFFIPNLVQAQSTEITPYAGWMLGGRINFYEGQFRIKDNAVYGVSLNREVGPGAQLELGYYRMDTEGQFQSYYPNAYPSRTIQMAVNYFQVGAIHSLGDGGPAVPFFLGSLGAAWYESKEVNYGDVWRFSVALGGGLKVYFSDRVGIRLQARMDLPLYFAGLGIFCGTGGCGVSANSIASIVHGDFTGGLIIRLGD